MMDFGCKWRSWTRSNIESTSRCDSVSDLFLQ